MKDQFTFTPPGTTVQAYGMTFQGLPELAQWLDERHASNTYTPCGWTEREDTLARKAERRLHTGDPSLVEASDKLISMIEADSPMGAGQMQVIRTVSGGSVDVPTYLAGVPTCMRQRHRREAKASLRIVVNLSSSAIISDDMLARRGAATLALLRLLEANGHPVELWVMHAVADYSAPLLGGAFTFVKLDTQPIDLARAAWALGSTEFSRYVIYAANTTHTRCSRLSPWPWDKRDWKHNRQLQVESVACAMGLEVSDLIYLPMAFATFMDSFRSDAEAVKWVNAEYAAATKTFAAEAA